MLIRRWKVPCRKVQGNSVKYDKLAAGKQIIMSTAVWKAGCRQTDYAERTMNSGQIFESGE